MIAKEDIEITVTKRMTVIIPEGENIEIYVPSFDDLCIQFDECTTNEYEVKIEGKSCSEADFPEKIKEYERVVSLW